MDFNYKCSSNAVNDYKKLNNDLKATVSKMIRKMKIDPWCKVYEKLQGGNWMSRRINKKHRMVYEIEPDLHFFYLYYMYSHYEGMRRYKGIPKQIIEEMKTEEDRSA